MLQNIKQFFDQHILTGGRNDSKSAERALQIATAALLFDVMRTDGVLAESERRTMVDVIRRRFALTEEETTTIARLAETEAEQATDYYRFTTLINKHCTAAQKEQIVENMWEVAYADHEIDRFERSLVHKIADLLYVPRAAQIGARERARRRIHKSGVDQPGKA